MEYIALILCFRIYEAFKTANIATICDNLMRDFHGVPLEFFFFVSGNNEFCF